MSLKMIKGDLMLDDNCQGSAEFILLFGGIIVVVLLIIFFYRNYISNLSGEINSNEVNDLNKELNRISDLFT